MNKTTMKAKSLTDDSSIRLQEKYYAVLNDFNYLEEQYDNLKTAKEALEKEKAQLSSEIQKLRLALAETVKEKFGLR